MGNLKNIGIERLKLVFEGLADGLWDWDLITNDIYYSPRWKSMLGYKDHELPNKFSVWEELTKDEDIKRSFEILQELIDGKRDKFEVEFKMLHKDGYWVDILSRANIFLNDEGVPYRVVGTHTDISKRKKAERKLLESEERFRKMIDNMPNGVAIYKFDKKCSDFIFIDLNKEGERITRASKEELIGDSLLNRFPNMDKTPLFKELLKVEKEGGDLYLPPFYYKDSNREGWRENYIYKLNTGEIVAIFKDVTELKEAEIKLKDKNSELLEINRRLKIAKQEAEESELRFKALHNASFGGITIHDKGVIIDCNKGLSEITGYSYQELIGMDGLLLIAEDKRDLVMENILSGYEKPYEAIGVRKNGERYPLHLEARKIPYKGKIVRSVEFRDITDQKRYEKELIISKEKAEESDRLKSAFLSNMSHEIRTPMNGILGFTALLKDSELSCEEKKLYIEIIEKSGQRLLNTIEDIIDISKIEAGEVEVKNSKVLIDNIFSELYQFFIIDADKKGIELIYDRDEKYKDIEIITDQYKLMGILSNLIKNGIKFSLEGDIKIGFDIIKEKDIKYIKFYVKDKGIGIPENRLKAIFNRFEQADIEDTRVFEGSGLGLAISKSYVEMLGGKIWVTSKQGEGSQFYFTIPFKKEKGNNMDKNEDNKKNINEIKKYNILIAEDDEINQIHLNLILKVVAKEIFNAKTGLEAIQIVKDRDDIDVILMDIKMPEMDGYEATRKIREFNKDVIIIAQTAYALVGDKEKALSAGCNDYISKPINRALLYDMIKKYVGK